MATLLYNPGIHIAISTMRNGLIDVSDDIESGSLQINENSQHALQFTLSNRGGKYNQLFTPNDRVTVQMKRIRWLQTFSGYLDVVPYFSVYDRSITMVATCTLKRIQFHWWDPGFEPTLQFLQSLLTNQQTSPDAGTSNVIKGVLTGIVGWESDRIHIGSIPSNWMNKMVGLWSEVSQQVSQSYDSVGGLIVGGAGTVANGSLIAPNWGSGGSEPAPPGAALPLTTGPPVPFPGGGTWDCTMPWPFNSDAVGDSDRQQSQAYLGTPQLMLVANANTGEAICVQTTADPMPSASSASTSQGAIALSTKALAALGLQPNGFNPSGKAPAVVDIAWAPLGTPLGPYSTAIINTSGTGSGGITASGGVTTAQGGIEAANIAIAVVGLPYKAGADGPSAFSDAGLVYNAWRGAGQSLNPNGKGVPTVGAIEALATTVPPILAPIAASALTPGCLLFSNGSVAMFVGNNSVIQAVPGKGVGEQIFSADDGHSGWVATNKAYKCYQVQAATNSGTLASVTPTTTFSTTSSSGLNTALSTTGSGTGGLIQPNWWPIDVTADPLAADFTGLKTLMLDAENPLLPSFQQFCLGGLRSFCAAPDGSFIAWFPDYFDQYGTAAKWYLSTIEMQDFTLMWSDQNMVTHQFTAGTPQNQAFNQSIDPTAGGEGITEYNMLMSMGVATIDVPDLLQILFNLGPDDQGVLASSPLIYKQFGPRPNFQPMVQASQGIAEFWYAVRLFMQAWSSQFSASIPMTFMPELWPGMILVLQDYGVQAYITQVTHSWDLSEGGGFSTNATVIAPSDPAGGGLIGLARTG